MPGRDKSSMIRRECPCRPCLFQRLLSRDDILLRVSPWLFFYVLLRRARRDLQQEVFTVEKPFDLKALSERLEKVFPTMVRLYEDKGFIWVMDKVKLTEKGVAEGSGPAAERVQKVYDLFIKEAASK